MTGYTWSMFVICVWPPPLVTLHCTGVHTPNTMTWVFFPDYRYSDTLVALRIRILAESHIGIAIDMPVTITAITQISDQQPDETKRFLFVLLHKYHSYRLPRHHHPPRLYNYHYDVFNLNGIWWHIHLWTYGALLGLLEYTTHNKSTWLRRTHAKYFSNNSKLRTCQADALRMQRHWWLQ